MVVGLIVEEISNVDAKYVKVTGAQNIGQGHRVKVCLFVLRFYGPVNPMGSCRARSVY